jgi:hypothetical protein
VDDVAVLLEHVDLLNSLDGLDVQLLEGGLELLVVGISGAVDLLDLAAGSALASIGGKKELVSPVSSRSSRWCMMWVVNSRLRVSVGEVSLCVDVCVVSQSSIMKHEASLSG